MPRSGRPRCGRISYTNDLPVYAAFDLGVLEFPGTLRPGVPAELNRALLAGELDISPISSVVYAQHMDELVLLPDICIAARRDVRSICCLSTQPIAALAGQSIAVTKESATGRALFDVICRHAQGFAPTYVDSDDPLRAYREGSSACLVIGDTAIDGSLEAPAKDVYDVGALWHDLTGLGMVYALWVARKDFAGPDSTQSLQAVQAALEESLRYGLDHLERVVQVAQQVRARPAGFYEAYFEQLQFEPDVEVMKGFNRFLQLASHDGLLAPAQTGMITR